VVIAVLGLLQAPGREGDVPLRPVIMALAAILIIFMALFYVSLMGEEEPKLRPGETITI
jgi:hypothetical protein